MCVKGDIMISEPLKNMYNDEFFEIFTDDLKLVLHDFDLDKFVTQIRDKDWESKEFKQRGQHITRVLKDFLPTDYKDAIAVILDVLKATKHDFSEVNDKEFSLGLYYGWILDGFIELYGLDDYDTSIKAIETLTQYTSCEFSVRPFIIKYPEKMMNQMLLWAKHKHWGVRRLSSEGCRPRLPWAMAIPALKKDPTPIIPILETLKNDISRFVRLSVANNLNDIAKDNPDIVIDLAKKWHGQSKELDWMIKHGSRTLLKQGNPEIMNLLGFGVGKKNISVGDFQIINHSVQIGDSLEFKFNLVNNNNQNSNIRLEYAIYYQKANKTLSKKVHKISEKEYPANSSTNITRRHPFKVVTTRVLHPGLHQVSVIINGNELEKYCFTLCVKDQISNHF
jgi:3-methyladenine DNA glycosylase AlkC